MHFPGHARQERAYLESEPQGSFLERICARDRLEARVKQRPDNKVFALICSSYLPTKLHTTDPLVDCIRPSYLASAWDTSLTQRPRIAPAVSLNNHQEHHTAMASLSKDDLKNLGRAPSKCVGPEYKDSKDKPTATVSTEIHHDNVHILPQTPQLISLLTYVISFASIEANTRAPKQVLTDLSSSQHHPRQKHKPFRLHLPLQPYYPPACRRRPEPLARPAAHGHHARR
jgi:hypothetical protein